MLIATTSVPQGLRVLQVRMGREAWRVRLDRQETLALPAQMDKTAPKDQRVLRVQKGHQDLLALMALTGHRGHLEQTAHRDSKANRGLQARMAQKDRKGLLVLLDQGSRSRAAIPMTPSHRCPLRRPETIGDGNVLIANFVADNPGQTNSTPDGAGDSFYTDYYAAMTT